MFSWLFKVNDLALVPSSLLNNNVGLLSSELEFLRVPRFTPPEAIGKSKALEFNNKVDSQTWNTLKVAPYKYLNVQYGENKFDLGYPEEISRNILTGETSVRLLRKRSGI
jgi:hypothetical protein